MGLDGREIGAAGDALRSIRCSSRRTPLPKRYCITGISRRAAALGERGERVDLGERAAERLLADHVPAGLEAAPHGVGVQERRQADVDDVDALVPEDVGEVGAGQGVRQLACELAGARRVRRRRSARPRTARGGRGSPRRGRRRCRRRRSRRAGAQPSLAARCSASARRRSRRAAAGRAASSASIAATCSVGEIVAPAADLGAPHLVGLRVGGVGRARAACRSARTPCPARGASCCRRRRRRPPRRSAPSLPGVPRKSSTRPSTAPGSARMSS